jgi:peroxisome-assembly ATPase
MPPNAATGLAITNPLVKYRSLLATKAINPDNGQLRLALHLQKLYDRLKDYEPEVEYSQRLDQISRAVRAKVEDHASASQPRPSPRKSTWRSLLAVKEKRDSLALTRRLTSHEAAKELTSPKGLMLHGEVGTGKSMLIDLFADCLPNRKKRRWHFNTFMLETFAKLESFRRQRLGHPTDDIENDYSMLWLAKDMIQTSPILFLDEFQMPDRVASKILTNLMTSFFHLGGVLIATSNRMPDELAKASGIEFQPPPSRLESLGWQFGFRRSPRSPYFRQNEFTAFLEVLKARCEVWEMDGGKDYRRLDCSLSTAPKRDEDETENWRVDGHEDLQHSAGMAGWPENDQSSLNNELRLSTVSSSTPRFFHLISEDDPDAHETYESVIKQATGDANANAANFTPSTMIVYGRTIPIPRSYNGVTEWTFAELCKTTLGPADYTTLASTYHTLILKDVPVLTWLMKNEARRFITLLDALYECRCKLYITAAADPDHLFFPEKRSSPESESDDAIQSETFSEAYQDATAPFRPNILSDNPNYAEPDPEPDYTHARLAGLLNADALEDDPPNRPAIRGSKAFGRSFGRTDSEMERKPVDPDEVPTYRYRSPDFGKTSAFTGEDERFAYKRAQSRLWEMCGAKWWARSEGGWHRPLPVEVRRWERSVGEASVAKSVQNRKGSFIDVTIGEAAMDETRDEKMFKHGGSPFRATDEPPPKFSWVHAWGTMKWGPKVSGSTILSQCLPCH